jgi:cold shock CspA family protein
MYKEGARIRQQADRISMTKGHIARILLDRGYGFVIAEGTGEELEFHATALRGGRLEQLHVGQVVEFDEVADHREPGRTRAINVRLST